MKIILVTGSTSSMPLAGWLFQQGVLAGIAVQDVLNNHNGGFLAHYKQQGAGTIIVGKDNIETVFPEWINGIRPDIVIVYGFSFMIPRLFFDFSRFGFYNIHFSLLPAYKGPSPLFWQLRNGEKITGVSLHRMTEKADSGEVLVQLPYRIMEDDTLGILHTKLSEMVVPAVQQLLHLKLYEVEKSMGQPAYQPTASYQKRPEQTDILIDWKNMSAFQIRCLVQAANPVYQGACTFFKDMEVRILQADIVNKEKSLQENKAGDMVVGSDEAEVICSCGSTLRLEIIATALGVMTGKKWKQLFVGAGEYSGNISFS